MFNPTNCLILSILLFAIGAYGVIAKRNILIMLMSVEIMLNAANLAFLTFARLYNDPTAHVFVLMNMAVAAAEVAVGLALLICVFRHKKSVDSTKLNLLKW
ncbi:MAG: NADH-quinone oxidoreductase subunit NuoK [Planctomycetes bacterium]|nr:NADH-quinone oxidoreductase subunit NuoK [Planctomycetota bacterium]